MDEITVVQYAAMHVLNPSRVRKFCQQGRLPCRLDGKRYLIPVNATWPAGYSGRHRSTSQSSGSLTCPRCHDRVGRTAEELSEHLTAAHGSEIEADIANRQALLDIADLMHVRIGVPMSAPPTVSNPFLADPPLAVQEALFERALGRQGRACIYPCPNSPRVLLKIDPRGDWSDDNLQAVCPSCARRVGRVLTREWELAGLEQPEEDDTCEL